ncbi:protein kinase domain containing protein, putative [Babesia bigemina]|uniref:Protein kinase domain containing protein, putative n=1 Tax=Babesia bigemina TaxID=5866 RepID=A0A061D5U0_BABBI|nr:protein kinase domain containing protein, putative [Babesia bigemina]CDR95377.1 protein kinase domain containing protein, putative [Babesia bigemina]|eukprot:XP_012767563.1 protein kinase domain containing protein, putative [Babesia bigemina]
MNEFIIGLVSRLADSDIRVVTKCVPWTPIKICHGTAASGYNCINIHQEYFAKIDGKSLPGFVVVGRAVNQYFFQSKIAQTSAADIWLCFDVTTNSFCCIKAYSIESCRRQNALRFCAAEMEVVSLLDKVIDEVLYHSSVTGHPGVSTLREVIISVDRDVFYIVMDYYPCQLLHFHSKLNTYVAMTSTNHVAYDQGESCMIRLYKEDHARRIMKDIIGTVIYLHSVGIVHKDLKPENILLLQDDTSMYEAVNISYICDEHQFDESSLIDENESYNPYCNEILGEYVERFLLSEVTTSCYEIELSHVVEMHFPYDNSVASDSEWLWDNGCDIVCDIIQGSKEESKTMRIGKAALHFAKTTAESCMHNSCNLLDFFLSASDSYIPYKKPELLLSAAESWRGQRFRTNQKALIQRSVVEIRDVCVVITDFGVSSIGDVDVANGQPLLYDGEGTTSFCSPESLQYVEGPISGSKREIFSLGVILYAMIYGVLPHEGNSCIETLINMLEKPLIFHNYRPVSPDLKDLLKGMLNKDPKQRLSTESILAHPWFEAT